MQALRRARPPAAAAGLPLAHPRRRCAPCRVARPRMAVDSARAPHRQAFFVDQLRALAATGLRLPESRAMPPCIWHTPNRCAPARACRPPLRPSPPQARPACTRHPGPFTVTAPAEGRL
jgi:hypothetical protein